MTQSERHGSLEADQGLLAWARGAHQPVALEGSDFGDLAPLKAMIGDARIICLGEGLHGSREPLAFRNRLFSYLVETLGVTAIVLESGSTAGLIADDFVQGGPGDASDAAVRGITHGLGVFPQQADLLRWMRAYNAARGDHPAIRYYGMDVESDLAEPGSALDLALEYLDRVNQAAAADIRGRLDAHRAWLWIDRMIDAPGHFAYLPDAARDAVTATLTDLVMIYRLNELAFAAATGEPDFTRGERAAVAAWQGDQYLRQTPVGWRPDQGPVLGSVGVADRVKADNLRWIVEQQGPDGRVLVFSHLGHAAPTPVTVNLGGGTLLFLPPLMGEYLKRWCGDDLVIIGHFLAEDLTGSPPHRPAADPATFEGLLAQLEPPNFLLDLRAAPEALRRSFDRPHDLFGQRPTHTLNLAKGVDIVFFTRSVSNA